MNIPPLTRERHFFYNSFQFAFGITPAYAGTTYSKKTKKMLAIGSPPLTRERLFGNFISRLQVRITPAHAGKTGSRVGVGDFMGDHPRSRGKDLSLIEQ